MELLTILSAMVFLSVCVTGILLLLVLTERNRLQKTLVLILGVFGVLILGGLINMLHLYGKGEPIIKSPLSFHYLVTGFIAFFITIRYYIVAAHRRLLTTRNSLLLLSPVLVTLTIYIVWHWGAGVPMNYNYTSLEELWANRYTVPVMLRGLMYLFFLIYEAAMFADMWRLDVGRSKESVLNSPDAVSNLRSLRRVVMGFVTITAVYTLLLFAPSAYSMLIYVVVASCVFVYFIHYAITRRMYEDTQGWQMTWSVRGGWQAVGEQPQPPQEPSSVEATGISLAQIDAWMKAEKPYCSADFSATDIIDHFEGIDKAMLTAMLEPRDTTPSSYIRRLRIEQACSAIRKAKMVKILELAPLVGFSHSTSFSRAFSAVMGETVTDYIKNVGAKRKANVKSQKRINKDKNKTI